MAEALIPSLLNEQLMERAVQSYHKEYKAGVVEIKAYDFKLSSASGENFCSSIYEANVEYKLNGNTQTNSFIVKIMIPEIAEIGSNEQIMFNSVLPAMEKCLQTNGDNSENKLHARCLISERHKDEFYVLENLNSLGYYCADRLKGLNLEQALVLMRKIGKFHAASMLFAKQFPKVVQSLRGSHFENGASDATAQAIAFGGFEYVAKMIHNWPSYKNFAQKVHAIIPKFNAFVMEVVNAKNSKFNVINHGDLWVNNFLYKCEPESGQPLDVLFVDFQNCFWGSCGFDINWFLNTSLQLQVLKQNRLQLIQSYHDSLKQTLDKLNFPTDAVPSFEDVLLEIKRCEIIGLYTSLCELPIVALDISKSSQGLDCKTFSQPDKMDKIRIVMYDNIRIKETLEYTLNYFSDINIL